MNATFEAQAALLRQAQRIFGGSPVSEDWEMPLSPFHGTSDGDDSLEEVTHEPCKKRKPTYYVRKDEKIRLAKEVEELQQKVRELQETRYMSAKIELDESIQMNALLGADVVENNMALAGAQSMISAEMVSRFRNPLDHYIYMPEDVELRKHSLATLQKLKVETGTRLIRERMRYLDMCQPHRHIECTVLKNGDYLVTQFDVTPFEGQSDVRLVFEQFVEFVDSQDNGFSDKVDFASSLEPGKCAESSAKQCRMLSSIGPGLDVETNAALFTMFVTSPDGVLPSYGIGIIDYVDKDDLYEYQPSTRLRKDITACVYVTQTLSDSARAANDQDVPGTTMVRLSTIRLHRAQFPISKQMDRRARGNAENWASVMPNALLKSFGLY